MIPRRASDLPVWYNAVDILERNLEHRADAQALVTAERELTFGQVAAEVNRVGHAMKALGVRPGDRVAILCLDCAEWAISFFACLKIGAVAVGMNTLLTARELRHILIDSDARLLLVHSSLREVASEAINEDTRVEHVVVVAHEGALDEGVTYEEWILNASEQLSAERVHRDDFGTLNY